MYFIYHINTVLLSLCFYLLLRQTGCCLLKCDRKCHAHNDLMDTRAAISVIRDLGEVACICI